MPQNINENLFNAVKAQSFKAIHGCLRKGADINHMHSEQGSALHHAVQMQQFEMVKFLVLNEADINLTNQKLETPIEIALNLKNYPILFYLLRNRKSATKQLLEKMLKFCYESYTLASENSILLDYVASHLTKTDIGLLKEKQKRIYTQVYFNHLNHSGKDLKIVDREEIYDDQGVNLEGSLAEILLPLRIRSFLEILVECEQGYLDLPAGINRQQTIIALRQEVLCELETLHLRQDANISYNNLVPIHLKDDLLAALTTGMLNRIAELYEGEEYSCHSGWKGHAVYINFMRQNNYRIIRIDNLIQGLPQNLHPSDTQDTRQRKACVLGKILIPHLWQDQRYLEDIILAKQEEEPIGYKRIYNLQDQSHFQQIFPAQLDLAANLEQEQKNCVIANHNAGLRMRLNNDGLYTWIKKQELLIAGEAMKASDINLTATKVKTYWQQQQQTYSLIDYLIQRFKAHYRKQTLLKFLLMESPPLIMNDKNYIPLDITFPGGGVPINIQTIIKESVEHKRRTIIYGRRGSGKSALCQYITYQQVAKEQRKNAVVKCVVWIRLRNLTAERYPINEPNQKYSLLDIIKKECLEEKYFPDYILKEWENLCHADNAQVLWLLDGYDELPVTYPPQLAEAIKALLEKGACIITSQVPVPRSHFDTEYEIQGFNNNSIEDYIRNFFTNFPIPPEVNINNLLTAIKTNPRLHEICRTPINLELICSTLPKLQRKLLSSETTETLLLSDIYKQSVKTMIERHWQRQGYNSASFTPMILQNTEQHCIKAMNYLAFAALRQSLKQISKQQAEIWINQFTKTEYVAQLTADLLDIGLIKLEGNQLEFIHSSFGEYFAANRIYQKLNFYKQKPFTVNTIHWIDQPLGQLLLNHEKGIISFLVEFILRDKTQSQLIEIVEYSREEHSKPLPISVYPSAHRPTIKTTQNAIKTAAANAMTLLNQAGFIFSGENFAGVRIKGADLSQGIFHQTNFSGANIKNVNMQQSFLRQANFNHTKLQGIQWGELAYLEVPSSITCTSYNQNGNYLAAGCNDGHIYIYDWLQGRLIQQSSGREQGRISCLLWQKNYLIWGGDNNTIKIWDTHQWSLVKILTTHHQDDIVCLAVHDSLLVAGSKDNTISLWDLSNNQPLRTLQGHQEPVICLAFRPDGQQLASGSLDQTIRLWDISNPNHFTVLRGHKAPVQCLAYSPDGRQLASGSDDKTIRLWSIANQQSTVLTKHADIVTSLQYHPTGKYFASTSWDKTLCIWDIKAEQLLQRLHGHQDFIDSLAYHPQGRYLASGGRDAKLRIWELPDKLVAREDQRERYRHVSYLAWDGNQFMATSQDGYLRWRDVTSGNITNRLFLNALVNCFAGNGKHLACAVENDAIQLWENKGGEKATWQLTTTLTGHSAKVTYLVFNDNILISASEDKTVRLWNVVTGQCLQILSHPHAVTCFVLYNSYLISGSEDKQMRIWNTQTGQLVDDEPTVYLNAITCFTINGQYIISGSEDGTIRLWDIQQRSSLLLPQYHQTDITQIVTTSINGSDYMISWDESGKLVLWDAANSRYVKKMEQTLLPIQQVIHSPQQQSFMSLDAKGAMSYWRASAAFDAPAFSGWQLQWTGHPAMLDMAGMQAADVKQLRAEYLRLIQQRQQL